MELTGTIKLIDETKEYGSNGFKKREFVLRTEEQYSQDILLEVVQDKCSILDNYNVGDFVTVGINLRGRSFTNQQGEEKYFNSILAWKISRNGSQQNTQQPVSQPEQESFDGEEEDDLPFN
jgi:hypothetical protein